MALVLTGLHDVAEVKLPEPPEDVTDALQRFVRGEAAEVVPVPGAVLGVVAMEIGVVPPKGVPARVLRVVLREAIEVENGLEVALSKVGDRLQERRTRCCGVDMAGLLPGPETSLPRRRSLTQMVAARAIESTPLRPERAMPDAPGAVGRQRASRVAALKGGLGPHPGDSLVSRAIVGTA
jgi:hypothetical protein